MSAAKDRLYDQKIAELEILSQYRKDLRKDPQLRFLFLELTLRCNANCIHCGSRCGEVTSEELSKEDYFTFLNHVKTNFEGKLPMLCITGGEPLLRNDFFEIMNYAKELGFSWGMTSNGTLITGEIAQKLKSAGMCTVSISVDGTEEIHDRFRRVPGGYRRTLEGIRYLMEQGFEDVQVTTVATKKSLGCLDELFDVLQELDVDSWRILGLEPIGRALDFQDYALDLAEQRRMLDFIKAKRQEGYPVTYGCPHYLGLDYEREVRDWYFLCNAGVYTASIMANGDIGACLDIERRPETVQGNILRDDFTEVWRNRFGIFRSPLSEKCQECLECPDEKYCEGGAYHSWNYDRNEPRLCLHRL